MSDRLQHDPEPTQLAEHAGTVAIIGMAGRFPGAPNLLTFWQNLLAGRDSIARFQPQGKDSSYVGARGILDGADLFDAEFFGLNPREAEQMDPQHRIFLETCQQALDDAGYDSHRFPGEIGLFAGCSLNTYLLANLCQDRAFIDRLTENYQVGEFAAALGNDKDFLTTRAAYKLNLRGPVVTVASACATSLVAIAQAAQSLLNYECDMALAGGVSITFPQQRGHLHQEGSLTSADGTCRPFDAAATGTVFGHGAGIVVLKRYADAVRDGDHIEALLRGFAVGNDGAAKAGYMAPGVDGQARVIRAAQLMAGVSPESITYLEAHGTGTPMGDPIEIAALSEVFREHTSRTGFCTVGTAKGNIGHLDAAAGVTGIIKTVLSLKFRAIPGLAHFQSPNPELDLVGSPFVFSGEAKPWSTPEGVPRRAGVSAFGVGGVNAHLVLEQAPELNPTGSPKAEQIVFLSAHSQSALGQAAENLAHHLEANPAFNLADVAFTLTERSVYPWRLAITASNLAEAVHALRQVSLPELPASKAPAIALLFPGQGSQFPGMGRELYRDEPAFRATVDRLAPIVDHLLGCDLRALVFSTELTESDLRLHETRYAQPALFLISLASAHLLRHWGIAPQLFAGHSLGEFTAATLAGVMTPEQAMSLVCERGRLMQGMAPGAMISLPLDEAAASRYLLPGLEIAALNSLRSTVLAGSVAAIEQLEAVLAREDIASRRLLTSHAFHSVSMQPMLDAFEESVAAISLQPPTQPYVSSVTGSFITAEQATSPRFWAEACRKPVLFRAALETLQSAGANVFLEAGPGRALTSLGRRTLPGVLSIPTLTSETSPLQALASLVQAGANPDWKSFFAETPRRRVSLPTYPFERKRFWIDPPVTSGERAVSSVAADGNSALASNPISAPETVTIASTRLSRLASEVALTLTDLSGIDLSPADHTTSFFELGFDSLFLTQATLSLSRRFSARITFRQLMEQFPSIDDLARYLDATLPADPDSASPIPAPARDTPPSVSALLEKQMTELSTLFAGQIAALRAAATGLPQASSSSTALSLPQAAEIRHGSFRPVQPRISHEITLKQQTYLDSLIDLYTARTVGSKARTAAARPHLADPRAVAGFRPQWKEIVYPILTDHARGAYLTDVDGNRYIDIVNGYGCILFGHSPDFVVQAVTEQLQQGVAIGPQSILAGEVAERICEFTGNERVTFCNTGSEAVMAAIRVARTVTGRDRFVYFGGDYHGTFDEVLLRPSPRGASPVAPGIPTANTSNVAVLEYGSDASLTWLREHAEELAAVLVEPVQTRNPANQPFDFLREVRRITEASGTAFILDEVVTGFRVSNGGMQDFLGIRADLCTYGKVLGGGHPIGVLSGKARFLDALDGGAWQYGDASAPEVGVTFFAGTFVRHPLALAAARAVLEHLKTSRPTLQSELNARTAALAESLDRFFVEREIGARVHHFCSWFYFTLPHESRLASLFYFVMRAKGIHIQEGYPCFLTTSHTEADLHAIEQAFRSTILELQTAEILPAPRPPEPGPEPLSSVPLTEPQREIFFSAALSDNANCAFNEALTLTLRGPVRQDALLFALDAVFARHDALRSTISEDGETLHIGDAFTGHTEVVDLRDRSESAQRSRLAEATTSAGRTPFDLQRGPLLRSVLFLLAPDRATLLLSAHHIVLDGWSANQVLEEVATIYNQGAPGLDRLAPLLPFSIYAQTEHRREQAGDFAGDQQFWVTQFKDLSLTLDLPLDHPRPATKLYAGDTYTGALPSAMLPALKKFSAARGFSLYVALLSSFQLLLHRLTGQDQLVVGISTAGQSSLDGRSLVGHAVHFLPMLSRLNPADTADEHLRRTRTTLLDAQDHQEFTLGSLVHALTETGSLERHPGRLPLIEVQFNLERIGTTVRFDALQAEIEPCPKQFVNTDLFLNVIETPEALRFTCDYNRALLEPETIARWMALWQRLLESELADSTEPARALSILPEAERDFLVHRFNQTSHDFGPFLSAPELFLATAARSPNRHAVTCAGHAWTYAELAEYSILLARRLVAEGVQPEDRIGICLERSREMPGAMLAVMLAGAAYVPLDPRHPRERLSSIVADSGIRLMLTGRDPSISTSARLLDITGPQPQRPSTLPALSPESLAYVIYTSGSTGTPKGVAIPHSALRNLLLSMQRSPGLTPEDTLVAVTTLAFDIAALELLLPLVTGAHLVIATAAETSDGALLLDLLTHSRVTTLQATPGLWRILLDAGWSSSLPLKALCGGETLPRELADQLLPRASELWNVYGPTETTIWSSATHVVPGTGPLRLGEPVANTQFYILDDQLNPTPIGVTGELAIGGEGLARGYWNRPELTTDRFRPNPLAPNQKAGERLYRTGDLARRLSDGTIELLGRADFQVKIRGFRIELGDIESALLRSGHLREAAVLARAAEPGRAATLHAFFIPAYEAPAELPAALLRTLASTLPDYMLPQTLTAVEQMPRTPNGKLDRKALLALTSLAAPAPAAYTEPSTPQERELASIFADALNLSAVSTTSSIFELGADSLLIFRIAARSQRAGIPLKPGLIFEHRTIACICAHLYPANPTEGQPEPKPAARARIGAVSRQSYRLTPDRQGNDG